ncbi:hypothetical protein BDC45DRAFT_285314 [Circinella umbellata]|nr:hypothetical protein BDC45DRAFT_285314 [Circinella umbellata]
MSITIFFFPNKAYSFSLEKKKAIFSSLFHIAYLYWIFLYMIVEQQQTGFTRWLAPVTWLRRLQDISNTATITIKPAMTSLLNNNVNVNNNSKNTKKRDSSAPLNKTIRSFPIEVVLEIFKHLDTVTLYQLTLVSRDYRNTLIQQSNIWNPLVFEPQNITFNNINSILLFLTKFQLHLNIRFALFDRTSINIAILEKVLRQLPYITSLSIAHCNNIDCYQILNLLKSSAKNNTHAHNNNNEDDDNYENHESIISIRSSHTEPTPFLQHLSQIYMQGLFPSERGHKSYALEMLTYGMIKKLLLKLPCRDLSESHYALYQFWLLLRSRMLLIAGETDFRPPWLPDELVQFIQVTEGEQQQETLNPIADITPCHLCHKNVAAIGSAACKICGVSTPKSCAQCTCLQCGHILCLTCYRRFCGGGGNNNNTGIGHGGHNVGHNNNNTTQQALLPLSATAAAALVAVATTTNGQRPPCGLPWQIVRCRQCHLSRRVCGSITCQKPFMTSERRMVDKWFCAPCKEKKRNERWKSKARLLRRNVNRSGDDYIRWND